MDNERTGPVTISRELFNFLMGAGDLEGVHFGEEKGDPPGRFWWRKDLRAADVDAPAAADDAFDELGEDVSLPEVFLPDVQPGHWATPDGRDMATRCLTETREQQAMADVSDMDLANRIFLVDRDSLELIVIQTAAKERIRWLSAQLAHRDGMIADVNAAIDPVRHWYETVTHQTRYVVDVVRDMAFDIRADRRMLTAMRAALHVQDAAETAHESCVACSSSMSPRQPCKACSSRFRAAVIARRSALEALDCDGDRYLAMLELAEAGPAEAQQ